MEQNFDRIMFILQNTKYYRKEDIDDWLNYEPFEF